MLFTFPSRYWSTIGRQVVFSLGRWSSQIPTGFHVSRGTRVPSRRSIAFAYGAFTLSGLTFQTIPLAINFVTSCIYCSRYQTVPRPPYCNACRLTQHRFRLVPVRSPLLGESLLFSFPPGTEMFQFPGFTLSTYVFSAQWPGLLARVAPFGNPRFNACVAAPRGFSQLPTSFIAFWRQGIHHEPLVACSIAVAILKTPVFLAIYFA